MTRSILTEASTSLTATPVDGQPGRFLIKLIDVGWGSSGFYSAECLQAAAAAKVFPAGTQMYLDHPTESETYERPERTLRDLAGALNEDARWDAGLQALVAEADVFSDFRPVLAEKKNNIGVSIRAAAERLPGTGDLAVRPDGRPGYVVKQLIEAVSVDYVTRAGRGGEIMQVLESARENTRSELAQQATAALAQLAESRNVGQWIESRLHLELTRIGDNMYGDGYLTREERIALSGAVGSALDAFTASLTDSAPQLFDRDLWDDPSLIAAQVDESTTTHVPGHPAGRTTNQEVTMPEIAESELRELREAAGRVQTLESERDAAAERAATAESERDQAREANAAHERTTTIERILGEAIEATGGIQLNRFERAGVLGDAVVTDGSVDEAATRTAFDTALAAIVESSGAGRPRGLGGPVNTQEGDKVSLEDIDKLSESTFGPLSSVKEA